jgi:lysophospholipase L1-like esterase
LATQERPSPSPSLRVRLVAWAIVAVLVLALVEIAARVLFPYPEMRNFDRAHYSPQMVSGPLLKQASLAHASFTVESAPDGAKGVHALNLNGFRDREWRVERQAAKRLLVIGDSMVEGFLVDQNGTIPQVLQRMANEQREDVEILNLGVGGASLREYIPLIQDAVHALRPDEIALVFHANDLLGNPTFSPELKREVFQVDRGRPWIPRIISVAVRIARGDAVPRRWHQPPFPFFPAVPDPGNPWSTRAAEFAPAVAPDIAQAMRDGRFNPFNVNEIQGYEHHLRQPVDIAPWLDFIQSFLKSNNVAWTLTYVPQPMQVSDYYLPFKQRYSLAVPPNTSLTGEPYQQGKATLAAAAAARGIPFLDLTPRLREAEAKGEHLYWDYDEHLRAPGYALIAREMQALRQRAGLAKAP